jgi:cytochrome d ubiquinol oxidase subunit II
MPELTPALLIAGAILVALNAYVLLGGADFGGGVWDFFARGARKDQQRDLIAHAIGPVWEANHVWLILVIVLLFTCFPAAFSRLMVSLHLPLTLMLLGIVLRGSAFTFRSYGADDRPAQERWGRIFSIASVVTPLLLGIAVGAIAAGRVVPPRGAGFVADYVAPWLSPFTVSVGVFTLVLFAFLAAVYLTLEAAPDPDLQEDFRLRALGAGVLAFGAALLTLVLARREAPLVWDGLVESRLALGVHGLTAVSALMALRALWLRHFRQARIAAAAQVSFILWGWGLAQYPWMLPPGLSIADAAAPAITLRLTLYALLLGAVVLIPSLRYLFRVFKSEPGH